MAYVAKGRAGDGGNEAIISSRVSKYTVVNGIRKITKIHIVAMQVSLKACSDAGKFKTSRTWNAPSAVVKLSAGYLAPERGVTFR